MAFKALGVHAAAHINIIEHMGDKVASKALMDQLVQIAGVGDKMVHNMQQQGLGQEQPPVDPIEMAKLQLATRKQSLAEDKNDFGKQKFSRTQSLREAAAAADEVRKTDADIREDKVVKQKLALSDLEAAQSIAEPAAK